MGVDSEKGQPPESDDYADGYMDGRDPDAPDPGPNRSDAYKHSFRVGRAEIAGRPIPAALSRRRVARIEIANLLEG